MKKVFRNLFAAFAAVALVSSFASCSDGSNSDDENTTNTAGKPAEGIAVTGNEITFNVTVDSTNKDDTVLFVKYDRSAKGAKELITISDAELKISVNGTVTNTVSKISFALDEYGSSFSRAATPITDKDDMKEYKTKIPVGAQVKKTDVVKVQLVKGSITGEGKDKVKPGDIVVALVDKAEKVSYYKELCENASEYQTLVKVEKTAEEKKAEEDKAAAEKKAVEEKAAADKKAAEEKAAADKKAAEEKAAAEKAKTENSTSTSTTTENNSENTTTENNTTENNGGAAVTKPAGTVKTIEMKKNTYAGTPQTQIKLETGFDSLSSGDKVKVVLKGKADKALGSAEIIVVDTTEAANYWKNLAEPYTCNIGTDFDITTEFTLNADRAGTGANSMMIAINGLAGDETVNLWCTEYTVEKTYTAPKTAPEAVVPNVTNCKAYTLTTSKDAKKDDVGLTFQLFAGEGEEPATVTVKDLKVSVKIGDAEAVVKNLGDVTIQHHSWDGNAQESNARINLSLGSENEELASGTTVVLQVISANVSDEGKAPWITFALQQDGKYNSWEMLTAADSKAFVTE